METYSISQRNVVKIYYLHSHLNPLTEQAAQQLNTEHFYIQLFLFNLDFLIGLCLCVSCHLVAGP
jgi:hypothetical protein